MAWIRRCSCACWDATGTSQPELLRAASPSELQPVGESPNAVGGTALGSRADQVVHLEDLLLRRTRLGLLLPDGALGEIERIRDRLPGRSWVGMMPAGRPK